MQTSITNKTLEMKDRNFYIVIALFLNVVLITDLLRGIYTGWFGYPIEDIEALKVFIYIGIFIYVLYRIIEKPKPKILINGIIFFVLLICASILATPEILIIMPNFILLYFSRCFPGFYIGYSIKDYQYLFSALRIYIWIGLIYVLLMFTGIRGQESAGYQTVGYNLLLPALVAIISGFIYKKYYFFLGIILSLFIIGYGGRGALLCFFSAILILFFLTSNSIQTYKKLTIILLSIFCISLIYFNYNNILNFLVNIFPDSRSLAMLMTSEFTSDTGRFPYYTETLKLIYKHPFAFRGILSDRVLLATEFGIIDQAFGSYVHNIFLEFFIHYGIIMGSIFLVSLLILTTKTTIIIYRSEDIYLKALFSIVIGYNIQLLVSGSYLTITMFWVALGLMINIIYRNKYKLYR